MTVRSAAEFHDDVTTNLERLDRGESVESSDEKCDIDHDFPRRYSENSARRYRRYARCRGLSVSFSPRPYVDFRGERAGTWISVAGLGTHSRAPSVSIRGSVPVNVAGTLAIAACVRDPRTGTHVAFSRVNAMLVGPSGTVT